MATKVKIKTTKGEIIVRLYDETPKHRDNFIKLVNEGYFDGTLFHRVIKDFMIQGGDPESKNAPLNKMLGTGGPGYTIPAEFVYPKFNHGKTKSCRKQKLKVIFRPKTKCAIEIISTAHFQV